jgi:phosphate starvation-inducible PhoH-like protein
MAAMALDKKEVKRLILVRPAVEAGESLGFLPGSLEDKVDPYLRPIFDALNDFIGFEKTQKLIEKGIIEVAPLAFMRGRTLKDAFIILDEAQNTTKTQMKMLLTRIGEGSQAVINGDTAQIDLKDKSVSGLTHAVELLEDIPGISTLQFESKDVVRHPIVQKIVEAYEDDIDQSVFASLAQITRKYEQSLL